MLAFYNNGNTIPEIANYYKISPQAVSYSLRKLPDYHPRPRKKKEQTMQAFVVRIDADVNIEADAIVTAFHQALNESYDFNVKSVTVQAGIPLRPGKTGLT
jgi:hypothetical protein